MGMPKAWRASLRCRVLADSEEVDMSIRRTMVVFMMFPLLAGWGGSRAQGAEASPAGLPETAQARITVLYDAFGKPSAMQKDWGFAALIEYGGKRILFDTGDNPDILATNVRAKGADLSKLDFAVISHRHGDHMGGMKYLLAVNPSVKIYAPKENFGVFGFSLPSSFYRNDASLPPERRYYDGNPPAVMKFGNAWPDANFELIENTTEIAPGIHLIALVSDKKTTLELRELSLAIDTPEGIVLIVGCAHPGIDRIVEAAAAIDPRIRLIVGGLHLVVTPDPEIARIASVLRERWKVAYVAPGHCTGEPAFAALAKVYGERYLYAGLGTVIDFDRVPHAMAENSAVVPMDEGDLRSYRASLGQSEDMAGPELADSSR